MEWISINDERKPQRGRIVICYCPEWCDEGYQIAKWNGRKFYYDSQPNDDFNDYVLSWNIFYEAD